MKSGIRCTAFLLISATALVSARHVAEQPRVSRFLQYYAAVKNSDAPTNMWERLVFSYALSGRVKTATGGGPVLACGERPVRPFLSNPTGGPSRL